MSDNPIGTSMIDDNRAVSEVIGVVILFGFLIIALSMYQVEVVPQQNAETEFQHSGEVRNDLVELRAGILQAGSINQPQYQTVQLGTTYSSRTFSINPPSPAGTIRTTDPYPITISNNNGTPEGTITIPTRFIEYQPGYNELDRSPTWYDASVLYLDARDDGGGIAVIEDQTLVDDGEVQITALQNEFSRSETGQVTLELRPAENVTGNIPEGDLTVTVPTRLSENDWETKTNLPTNSDVYDGVTDTGDDINNRNIYNLTLNTTANNLTVDTVGVQGAPEVPTQTDNTRIGGDGGDGGDGSDGTSSTPSLTGSVENLPTDSTPTQNITFSPTGSTIPASETVVIDLSNANGVTQNGDPNPVNYENININGNFSGSFNTVNNGGTFAVEFTPTTNIGTGRTIGIQLQSTLTQDTITSGIPVVISRSDGDGFNTTFSLFDSGNGGGGGSLARNVEIVQTQINDGDIVLSFRNNNNQQVTFTEARLASYSEDSTPNNPNKAEIDRVRYDPSNVDQTLIEGNSLQLVNEPTISNNGNQDVTLRPQRQQTKSGKFENADAGSGDEFTLSIVFNDGSTREYIITL